jgi:hypothetical protein
VGGTRGSSATSGLLVLADISGYTGFLRAVGDAHEAEMAAMPEPPAAYPLMTSLLDGIVDRLTPPFRLSKLEGDAVFAYAPDDEFGLQGDAVLDCMRKCYASYRERRDQTENLMLCTCNACSLVHTLELKFVLHRGGYIVQSIAGHDELLGPDVTMAHLLLKNTVTDAIGRVPYALVTDRAAEHLEIPLGGSLPLAEHYEHYPPIQCNVFRL